MEWISHILKIKGTLYFLHDIYNWIIKSVYSSQGYEICYEKYECEWVYQQSQREKEEFMNRDLKFYSLSNVIINPFKELKALSKIVFTCC
jgi:hypothetical protein